MIQVFTLAGHIIHVYKMIWATLNGLLHDHSLRPATAGPSAEYSQVFQGTSLIFADMLMREVFNIYFISMMIEYEKRDCRFAQYIMFLGGQIFESMIFYYFHTNNQALK